MKNTVSHGDDLAYVFDVNDIYGNSLESNNIQLSQEDQKVRDIFTQMIADFAKTGKVNLQGKQVQPFSAEMNNFIQIKPKPVTANNFKYCEMALWCNLAERLKSTTCSFLQAFDTQIKNVEKVIGGVIQGTNLVPGNGGLNLNNLLGGGSSSKQKQDPLGMLLGGGSNQMSNQNRKPGFSGLGSLIG